MEINEIAGWLPVRAWCSSLGAPVKDNTPKALGWVCLGVSHWALAPLRWRKNSKPSHTALKNLRIHSIKSLNLPMDAVNAVKCPDVCCAAACQGSGWRLPRAVCCSYLLTRYAGSLGHYAAASQSCNFALRFFHSNQKDVSWKKFPPPWPCNTAKCLREALANIVV